MRVAVLIALCLVLPAGLSGQAPGVLQITVTLTGADQRVLPVPRHVLLVSDNPATTAPRKAVTALDGTASLRLPPGNYTVESDRPVEFQGRAYSWVQILDVPAGGTATLALSAANAEVGAAAPSSAPSTRTAPDPTDVLLEWQDSVVALWTPTAHASGIVIDAAGLVATNQQVVRTATSLEVQLSDSFKVAGKVLVADAASDVTVLWIDPAALKSIRPAPLTCGAPLPAALVTGQEIVALGVPRGRQTRMTTGTISRVASRTMIADLPVSSDSLGGPAFVAGGQMIGLTSLVGEKEGEREADTRVVRIDAVCEVVAKARTAMAGTAPPSAARLPIEPTRTIPDETLKEVARKRAGSLSPVQAASLDFDVAFLTPLQAYAGQASMNFANWDAYVADRPSVLLVRVTPKQVEKVWTKVARGVAMTKGVRLPPIKSFKTGFARMQAFCGDAEVTPIHPFLLERRVSETDAVYEGLYVFDPGALHPECGTVRLQIYSDKTPDKADPATVDPKVLQQVWQDFALYRELK